MLLLRNHLGLSKIGSLPRGFPKPTISQAGKLRTNRNPHLPFSRRLVDGMRFAGMHQIHSPLSCHGQKKDPPPFIVKTPGTALSSSLWEGFHSSKHQSPENNARNPKAFLLS